MRSTASLRALCIRVALTLICLAGVAAVRTDPRTADAQTAKKCTNTGCEGVDRCVFYGSVNCSMTNYSCTNTGC